MASGSFTFVVDADLHGLVDGHIEPDRRADALRRLAGSPADRARVEAWQSQNDLLRSAFAGVDREPLPVLLDLQAKPKLQCIPANDSPLMGPPGDRVHAAAPRRRFGAMLATILLVTMGVGGTWLVLDSAGPDDPVTTAKLRGSVDATLAGRAADAIDAVPTPVPGPAQNGDRLPTTQIPDLRATGFNFVGAELAASSPVSILFRYQNAATERLAISVARATPQDTARTTPVRIGNAFTWRKRDKAFAIAGTLHPARLRAIAIALQNGDAQD